MQLEISRDDDEPVEEVLIRYFEDRYGKEHIIRSGKKMILNDLNIIDNLNITINLKKLGYRIKT
jgi:hypothetical protein